MLADLRFALRQLLKAPGFTATIVVTLALAIGACTIVFSTVNTLLFDLFDDPATERNVILRQPKPSQPVQPGDRVSVPDFVDIQQQAKSFEFMAASAPGPAGGAFILTGRDEPLSISVSRTTLHGFAMAGHRVAHGRAFLPGDFASGQGRVVVISHAFWTNNLGGDPQVIGRTLQLNAEPYTVVGVRSQGWERLGSDIDVWIPNDLSDQRRGARSLDVAGRLRPGVSLAQAQAEMDVIAARLAEQYPETNQGYGLVVTPQLEYINRLFSPILRVLLGAVACVLLIACANVANLLLARATARQREIAVRAALGASRLQLVRQLLAESLLLALLGGAAGVLLALWGLDGVRAYAGSHPQMVRLAFVQLDSGMLAFALVLSLGTGLLFGLAPAWLASRVRLNESLRQGARGSTDGGARGPLRRALVVLEIACALVLLAGTGLLVRSFSQLMHRDLGLVPEHAAAMRVVLPARKYAKPAQRLAFAEALNARLLALPGVEAVAVSNRFPLDGSNIVIHELGIEGRPPPGAAGRPLTSVFAVTPGYFKATGIRLLRGRLFDDRDHPEAPRVAIVNETLARLHFADENPLGRRIDIAVGGGPAVWREIIGVVSDVIPGNFSDPTPCQTYEPFAQRNTPFLTAVIRTGGDPAGLLPLMKQQVYALDKDQPVLQLRTLENLVAGKVSFPRFTMQLLGGFSFIALLIATVGIYGVMSYSVSQRTTEIGIRMALGASQTDVLQQVLRQGMKIIGLGLGVGLVATLALGQLIRSLLFNTSPHDPLTLALMALALLLVALLACWFPARRATKVEPLVALRAE